LQPSGSAGRFHESVTGEKQAVTEPARSCRGGVDVTLNPAQTVAGSMLSRIGLRNLRDFFLGSNPVLRIVAPASPLLKQFERSFAIRPF
jgi:hypothetical protein